MMFTCKVCGYKYNMVTDFKSNKCMLCRSVSSSFYKNESKVMELSNPYDDR
jgi:hypothetical protein